MGWLDKGFKNIVRGARDIAKGPAGIMLLSAAAPWLAPKMAPWMAKLAGSGKFGSFASAALKSPWVKNAMTNAAIQGGIATLTRSKHPWKAMTGAALGSLPFTALQSAQAASAYNDLFKTSEAFTGLDAAEKAKLLAGDWKGAGFTDNPMSSWYDMALGKDMKPLHTLTEKYVDLGKPQPHAWENVYEDVVSDSLYDDTAETVFKGIKDTSAPPLQKLIETENPIDLSGVSDMASSYFTKEPGKGKEGWAGLVSDVMGPLDLTAAITPQVIGMAAGRMTDKEKWLAAQEKQIRLWAFQHGIPFEEAREIWADGWRNPYYETTPASEYQFVNRGGQIYKDDYTAGGKAVGPGTGTSDSIRPVALSDGEFVFTEEATNNFPGGVGGLYSLMNSLDPNSEKPHEAREAIV
jgi:hypothetical protein